MSGFYNLCKDKFSFLLKLFGFSSGCIVFPSVLVHVPWFSDQDAGVEQDLIAKNSVVPTTASLCGWYTDMAVVFTVFINPGPLYTIPHLQVVVYAMCLGILGPDHLWQDEVGQILSWAGGLLFWCYVQIALCCCSRKCFGWKAGSSQLCV
jgi:hypothetical protein